MKTVTRIQYNPEGEGKYLALPSDTITTQYGGKLSSTGLVINDVYEIDEIDLEGESNKLFSTVANIASVQSQPRGIHPIIDKDIRVEGYAMENGSLPTELLGEETKYIYTPKEEKLQHISEEEEWIEKLSTIPGLPPIQAIYKASPEVSLTALSLPGVLLDNRSHMSGYPLANGEKTVLTTLPYSLLTTLKAAPWFPSFVTALGLPSGAFDGTPKEVEVDDDGVIDSSTTLSSQDNHAYYSHGTDILPYTTTDPSSGSSTVLWQNNPTSLPSIHLLLPQASLTSGAVLVGGIVGGGGCPIGEPFKDSNGFHLKAPSWMKNGDTMEWKQLVPIASRSSNKIETNYSIIDNRNGVFNVNGTTSGYNSFPDLTSNEFIRNIYNHTVLLSGKIVSSTYWRNCLRLLCNTGGQTEVQSASSKIITITLGNENSAYNVNYATWDSQTFSNAIIIPQLFDLTGMNIADKVTTGEDFAKAFGYVNDSELPYFNPNINGTYVAYGGKLWKFQ